jgi:hypothetical protein
MTRTELQRTAWKDECSQRSETYFSRLQISPRGSSSSIAEGWNAFGVGSIRDVSEPPHKYTSTVLSSRHHDSYSSFFIRPYGICRFLHKSIQVDTPSPWRTSQRRIGNTSSEWHHIKLHGNRLTVCPQSNGNRLQRSVRQCDEDALRRDPQASIMDQ